MRGGTKSSYTSFYGGSTPGSPTGCYGGVTPANYPRAAAGSRDIPEGLSVSSSMLLQ